MGNQEKHTFFAKESRGIFMDPYYSPRNPKILFCGISAKKEEGRSLPLSVWINYLMLPRYSTVALVTAGSAEMSLETLMVPSNMPLTRVA